MVMSLPFAPARSLPMPGAVLRSEVLLVAVVISVLSLFTAVMITSPPRPPSRRWPAEFDELLAAERHAAVPLSPERMTGFIKKFHEG